MTDLTPAVLEELRLIRSELDSLRADLFAKREDKIRTRLPLRLTVAEFAPIVRLCEESVRRMIRSREIEAQGTPFMIPRRELEKFGVSPVDAEEVFKAAA